MPARRETLHHAKSFLKFGEAERPQMFVSLHFTVFFGLLDNGENEEEVTKKVIVVKLFRLIGIISVVGLMATNFEPQML